MPKTKTSSSVKKRFKVTAGGKLLRRRAMKSHNLTKKTSKVKVDEPKPKGQKSVRKGQPEAARHHAANERNAAWKPSA